MLIILLAVCVHVICGVVIFASPAGMDSPPFVVLAVLGTHQPVGVLLMSVGFLAFVEVCGRWQTGLLTALVLLLPQQILLGLSAAASIHTIADAVSTHAYTTSARPWSFVLTNQAATICIAVIHAYAVWRVSARKFRQFLKGEFYDGD